jgi:hypothetical protein
MKSMITTPLSRALRFTPICDAAKSQRNFARNLLTQFIKRCDSRGAQQQPHGHDIGFVHLPDLVRFWQIGHSLTIRIENVTRQRVRVLVDSNDRAVQRVIDQQREVLNVRNVERLRTVISEIAIVICERTIAWQRLAKSASFTCAVRCALCAVRCALCAVRCALCAVRCALCAVRTSLVTVTRVVMNIASASVLG